MLRFLWDTSAGCFFVLEFCVFRIVAGDWDFNACMNVLKYQNLFHSARITYDRTKWSDCFNLCLTDEHNFNARTVLSV